MAAYLSDSASSFPRMSSPNSCRSPMGANSENSGQSSTANAGILNPHTWVDVWVLVGHGRHAFQLNSDGRGEAIDFNGCAAWLGGRVGEILSVDAIERLKIAVHMNQENGDVEQFVPTATVRLQYGFDIGEHAVHLSLKIEFFEIPIVVQFQSGNSAIIGVAACNARPYTAQKKQVASFSSKWVGPNGLGSALNFVCHAVKIA